MEKTLEQESEGVEFEAASLSSGDANEENVANDEFMELREMMQDLQVGFTAAMTELSNIQDEDKRLYDKLNDSKREQEVQMRDVLGMVEALKAQCDDIQYQIEISNKNQRKLEKQIKKMKSERKDGGDAELSLSQYTPTLENLGRKHSGAISSDSAGGYTTSPMLKSYIASLPRPEDMEDIEDHHSDSDESLAAVTQKSLMLTNAIAQRAYDDSQDSSPHLMLNGDISNPSSERSESNQNGALSEEKRLTNGFHPPLTRAQVQRQKIAISIVESERSYCTTLYNITESYSNLLTSSGAISARDSSRMFPASLKAIYEYHCAVLRKLETRVARWRQQDIMGDIFGKFAVTRQVDIFSHYRDYIDNFTTSLQTVRKLNKTCDKFRTTVKKCQRQAGGDNLSLIAQLLAPVRRIPRLVLYIKKLLKHTDIDHPDQFFLESSLHTFRSSLLSMNEAMERSMQMAASDSGSCKRSVETCSWSSHEEDQRLSTATKDSGIHSNCDLDSHEELATIHYKQRERHSMKRSTLRGDSTDSSALHREMPARPKSMLDFTRQDADLVSSYTRRCKTPTSGMQDIPESPVTNAEKLPLKPSLSHSVPNLLDHDPHYADTDKPLQQKTKHKVQFKNPPEEHELKHQHQRTGSSKKVRKRSIADTLRIIFNRRKTGQQRNSASDVSDSCCELNSSVDEAPQPAPPHMFANGIGTESHSTAHESSDHYLPGDTYEDENGDPYSVV